jgi:ParB/RepB/Spo0J family partition protein
LPLGLPSDFAKKIRETLGLTEEGVNLLFEFEEDKQGYFVAKLKPKQFLEKIQFKTLCALARDLGGEGYLQGAKAWKVPGPYAQEAAEKPSGQAMDSPATYKEAGSVLPGEPSGVTPHVIALDKSKQPQTTVPLKALLAMPFQCRTSPEDPALLELTESIKTYGVLEPVLVRPKPDGLYEIVAGQRRVKAAQKAGLDEIPVIIRFWSDEEAFVLQLTENLQRKDLSEEEKTRALGELARKTGWTAQQIADKLKMSYRWVAKYLPSEFKDQEMAELGKLGAESKADSEKGQDLHVAARRAADESQDMREGIPCAHCGEKTSALFLFKGKKYCEDCIDQAKAEAVPSAFSESHVGPFEVGQPAEEPVEEPKPSKVSEPEPEPVDFAEATCSVCNVSFRLIHHGPRDHRIEYYGG